MLAAKSEGDVDEAKVSKEVDRCRSFMMVEGSARTKLVVDSRDLSDIPYIKHQTSLEEST